MSAQRHLTITTRDGVTLDALAQGPSHQPPLILLHGLSDSRLSFAPFLAALPEAIHAIAVSQRGHGASQKPRDASAYFADRFADDVVAVLDAVGHKRGDILGHSMGAWAALHCARRHPTRINRLVLIGGFARFDANPGVAALGEDVARLTDPVDPAFVRGFQESASSVDLPADFFEDVIAESMRLPAYVWRHVLAALQHDDVPSTLPLGRPSTLLVWGDCDPFVPRADQDALLNALPAATLHVFAGLGHSPHWDRPNDVAALVANFLSSKKAA